MPDYIGTSNDEALITVRKVGDSFPRLAIEADGSIKTGDGASKPLDDLFGKLSASETIYRGGSLITLGDSFLAGGGSDLSVPFIAFSKGRFILLRGAGVSGNSCVDMLNRMFTDVINYSPGYCLIGANTPNNHAQDLSISTIKNTIESIVNLCKLNSIKPILLMGPPNDTTAIRDLISNVNGWMRYWGPLNGVLVLNPYINVTDPTDGTFLSGATSDGTHLTSTATWEAGEIAANQVIGISNVYTLSLGANDPTNLVINPCFNPSSGGLATSWTKNGTATASVTAVTSGYGVGNWQELTAADTTFSYLSQGITTVIGNVYEFSCGIKSNSTGQIFARLTSSPATDPLSVTVARGTTAESKECIASARFTATSTTTYVYLGLNSAAGLVGFRQVTVRDLTALGVV